MTTLKPGDRVVRSAAFLKRNRIPSQWHGKTGTVVRVAVWGVEVDFREPYQSTPSVNLFRNAADLVRAT